MLDCIDDGIDVRGYTYWSALDNFEWAFGYEPRFGLVEVDRATQQRVVKPTGHWLGRIARANRFPLSQLPPPPAPAAAPTNLSRQRSGGVAWVTVHRGRRSVTQAE